MDTTPAAIRLRELTGLDERSVVSAGTAAAIDLLDRLAEAAPAGWRAVRLTAADRDRLLAAVYRRAYGQRVAGTVPCSACASPFDLEFALDELVAAVERAEPAPQVEALGDGIFRTRDGARFRLPTGEDELMVAALAPAEAERALYERCVLESPLSQAAAREVIEEAMEAVAPVLDVAIDTICPECGIAQAVRFDVQSYLLRALAQEGRQLAREVHRIATAYGWSLADILGLPRGTRRTFVELIESDAAARRRRE